jgi:hypothetical protein
MNEELITKIIIGIISLGSITFAYIRLYKFYNPLIEKASKKENISKKEWIIKYIFNGEVK